LVHILAEISYDLLPKIDVVIDDDGGSEAENAEAKSTDAELKC
jgi:hypothetical protein